MIRKLFILISFCSVMISCKKSSSSECSLTPSNTVVPASELATLQTYVSTAHPAAVLNSAGGFYYEILAPGTGTVTPGLCSSVNVKYAGYLTSGAKFTTPFEEITGATYILGGLITGWQRGIPLIKSGGKIKLILPPSLGYGSSASSSIPANSILIFVIDLVSVG